MCIGINPERDRYSWVQYSLRGVYKGNLRLKDYKMLHKICRNRKFPAIVRLTMRVAILQPTPQKL